MSAILQKIKRLRKSPSPYVPMTAIIQPEKIGAVEVDHFKVSAQESQFSAIRDGGYILAGKYARLTVHGQLMMTDTQMEKRTNYDFVHRAHGDVLISGLGLGMIVAATIDKPDVKSITVVEKYAEVISIVSKYFPSITCIHADIHTWTPPKGSKWNVIYHDIWPEICTDSLPEIYALERRFRKYLDKADSNRWQGSWQKERLQRLERRGW
jgi:hypothetical protein